MYRYNHTDDNTYKFYYVGLIIGMIIVGALRQYVFITMTTLAARNLHNTMFGIVLRAPISFFDIKPVGMYSLLC